MPKPKEEKAKEQTQEEEVKKIPLSKVIYTEIDDEVSSIYDRVKSKKTKEVFVVVPLRSILFQSIINVKILKRKTDEIDKKLSFITKDKSGIYFANQCKIPVYNTMGEKKKIKDVRDLSKQEEIKFRSGRPQKISKEKISISEITAKSDKAPMSVRVNDFLHQFWKQGKKKKQKKTMLTSSAHRGTMLTLTAGSVLLLFLIAYIALPNATITLKPNSVPIEQAVNITFADFEKNEELLRTRPNRVLPSYIVNPGILEKTTEYNATGNDAGGSNARGLVKITNRTDREFPLVTRTRFQTDEGLIFRSQGFIVVPAAKGENVPGTIELGVVADESDINNVPIGDKGNIAQNTKLFIPGLTSVSREEIFAEAVEGFTGGITSKDKIVTQRDIDGAKEFVKKELVRDIPGMLKTYVDKKNAENNLGLTLLNDSRAINIGDIEIVLDESIVGQKMNSFNVTARVEAIGVSFDREAFLQLLRDHIELRKSPDKELTKIDDEGVTYRVIKNDEENSLIDITATIKGVEQYELSQDKQSGVKLIKKIREHVAGMQITEAKKYIENLPEVESVEIKAWPFWAPTIPSVADNIKILVDGTK
jgi:hypothetical protein